MQFDSKLGMQKSYTDLYCIRDIKRMIDEKNIILIKEREKQLEKKLNIK